jgi:hypothetical protein
MENRIDQSFFEKTPCFKCSFQMFLSCWTKGAFPLWTKQNGVAGGADGEEAAALPVF